VGSRRKLDPTPRNELTQAILVGRLSGGNDVGDRPAAKGHPHLFPPANRMQDATERAFQLPDSELPHVDTLTKEGPPCARRHGFHEPIANTGFLPGGDQRPRRPPGAERVHGSSHVIEADPLLDQPLDRQPAFERETGEPREVSRGDRLPVVGADDRSAPVDHGTIPVKGKGPAGTWYLVESRSDTSRRPPRTRAPIDGGGPADERVPGRAPGPGPTEPVSGRRTGSCERRTPRRRPGG
jgi:hypothetical protein